jgi:virginiamycin B lyase
MKTIAIFLALVSGLSAETIQGVVRDAEGRPVAGAIVTVFEEGGSIQESGYSDASGSYRLETGLRGRLQVRARRPGYVDAIAPAGSALVLAPADALSRSNSLPASAHAASIQWTSARHKANFVSQCHYCHQIGNALTRAPKDENTWGLTIERMEGYGALVTGSDVSEFREVLAKSFNGTPVQDRQNHVIAPETFPAKITEWQLGEADSFMHDAELHPNGRIYAVDMSKDKIYELDRITNRIAAYDLPKSDWPLGGMFSGAYRPLGTFAAHHGPHSIQTGPDGKLWTTNSLAAEIMSFDPETHEFKVYPVPDAVYPHTLRFDRKGILWFTVALSNKIGRFDPATAEFKLVSLPSQGFFRFLSDRMVPWILKVSAWFPAKNLQVSLSHHKATGEGHRILNLPYGIDIHPLDGSVWYSKLYSGYIGRLDPETLEVTEYVSPMGGPRRMRFAPDGTLWIPSFEAGSLLRVNTQKRTFRTFRLPLLAEGEYETPYALAVHPRSGEVWLTSNLSDRMFRFDPVRESFTAYGSPTRVTYMRDILFDSAGNVCTTNSNMPAYAIEGGRQKVFCLNPGGASTRSGKAVQEGR